MDNALFVVNMQEMYVGKFRKKEKISYDAEELTAKVNKRILAYQPEEVFFIKSVGKGLFKGTMPKEGTKDAELLAYLKYLSNSKNVFEKNKSDCFSNNVLHDFIRSRGVKQIEFIGVDTGEDIGKTAITATEDMSIHAVFNEAALVSLDPEKSGKLRSKLRRSRVTYKIDLD